MCTMQWARYPSQDSDIFLAKFELSRRPNRKKGCDSFPKLVTQHEKKMRKKVSKEPRWKDFSFQESERENQFDILFP